MDTGPWSCRITDLSTGRSEAEIPSQSLAEANGAAADVFVTGSFGLGVVPTSDDSQEDREHIRKQLAVVGQSISDLEGQAEDPLPHRNVHGKDIVHQARGRVRHAPTGA